MLVITSPLKFYVLFFIIFYIQTQTLSPLNFSYISLFRKFRVDYPIRFTYINKIDSWWPPSATLAQMGVPSYAANHSFNYIALTFWTCADGPLNIAKVWNDPITYFGTQLGNDTQTVQTYIKRKYESRGISLLISAFGAS